MQDLRGRLQEQAAQHEAVLQATEEAKSSVVEQLHGTIESLHAQLAGRWTTPRRKSQALYQ